jgi:hypothetical protein
LVTLPLNEKWFEHPIEKKEILLLVFQTISDGNTTQVNVVVLKWGIKLFSSKSFHLKLFDKISVRNMGLAFTGLLAETYSNKCCEILYYI